MKTFKEYLLEELEVHHAAVVPIAAISPISHRGHAIDLGGALRNLPGTFKHIGISNKADLYSPEERQEIFQRQAGSDIKVHSVKGMGETLKAAYDSLSKTGKKVLHILVGKDRESFGNSIKKSLDAGKVKEMEDNKFDEVHVHLPEDENRTHGMSGTRMRQAAFDNDIEMFHKHLGSMFNREEAAKHMKRIGDAIRAGTIPLKR